MGLVLGIGLALVAGRAIRTLLFGITPTDPATFAGVAAVLILVAILANLVLARRARIHRSGLTTREFWHMPVGV